MIMNSIIITINQNNLGHYAFTFHFYANEDNTKVYINNSLLTNYHDYTINGNMIFFNTPLLLGDEIHIIQLNNSKPDLSLYDQFDDNLFIL